MLKSDKVHARVLFHLFAYIHFPERKVPLSTIHTRSHPVWLIIKKKKKKPNLWGEKRKNIAIFAPIVGKNKAYTSANGMVISQINSVKQKDVI
jgi:hypothetical protein